MEHFLKYFKKCSMRNVTNLHFPSNLIILNILLYNFFRLSPTPIQLILYDLISILA